MVRTGQTMIIWAKCGSNFWAGREEHIKPCPQCTFAESEEQWVSLIALQALRGERAMVMNCPQTCLQCHIETPD